jgi:hypothetical protein
MQTKRRSRGGAAALTALLASAGMAAPEASPIASAESFAAFGVVDIRNLSRPEAGIGAVVLDASTAIFQLYEFAEGTGSTAEAAAELHPAPPGHATGGAFSQRPTASASATVNGAGIALAQTDGYLDIHNTSDRDRFAIDIEVEYGYALSASTEPLPTSALAQAFFDLVVRSVALGLLMDLREDVFGPTGSALLSPDDTTTEFTVELGPGQSDHWQVWLDAGAQALANGNDPEDIPVPPVAALLAAGLAALGLTRARARWRRR